VTAESDRGVDIDAFLSRPQERQNLLDEDRLVPGLRSRTPRAG
jgi:hypothetical protein